MKKHLVLLALLVIALAVYIGFKTQLPSSVTDATAPKTEFSTDRAFDHLKEITKAPHYVGTEEHTRVRNYLIAEMERLGLTVEVQEQVAFNNKHRTGAKTKNIIARIKGTRKGKALLLLSHYDSGATASFGASDDGSGVVTILEGIRAFLAQNIEFKNDIIILFSDAEELGLLGASAFVKHHKWAKDVGLVINFEARGSGGSSYMLIETNGGNQHLIREFSNANPAVPSGNSLMYSIYKMLPNDTDLTVFRENGDIEGLNFAFIDQFYNYHMASDNYDNLSPLTLEHQGTYLMAMLEHFSNYDLSTIKSEKDDVYFNFPFVGMIYYPFAAILPMLIIAILIFIAFLFVGIKKQKLSVKQMLKGFIPFLLILIVAPIGAGLLWQLLLIIHPQYKDITHGFTYNGYYYIGAFAFLAIGFAFFIYRMYIKKIDSLNLMVAPIFFWLIFSGLTSFLLKGAAFFIIPAYLGLMMFAFLLFKGDCKFKLGVATILALPTVVIFAPFIQMFPVGLGLIIMPVSVLFIALIWGILIPIIEEFEYQKAAMFAFIGIGLLFIIIAASMASYSTERKKPNSLLYMVNVDINKAYWGSFDAHRDVWKNTYLGEPFEENKYDTTIVQGPYYSKLKLYKGATFTDFASAKISITSDTIIGEHRNLEIEINPQRFINFIQLVANSEIDFPYFEINGEPIKAYKSEGNFRLKTEGAIVFYVTKNEPIILKMRIEKEAKPSFTLFEISSNLLENKELNVEPRPNTMTPFIFHITDAIVTAKTLEF